MVYYVKQGRKRLIFLRLETKKEEDVGGWRILRNEELHNSYTSPNIIRAIKSVRMKWIDHVANMGDMRNAYKILVGKPERKNHSGDLGEEGKIILEWILWKQGGSLCTVLIWLRIGTSSGLLWTR
jgi:hypothetical protein